MPDPSSPLAPYFRLSTADQSTDQTGLIIDLPGNGWVDHAALADLAGQLLHSDLAAMLVTLTPTAPQPQPPLSPDTALDLTPAQHALLVKAAFACQPFSHTPQLRLAEQALRLCAAQAPIACAQAPVAMPRQIPPPALPDMQDLDQWAAALAPVLPPGGARRLFLRAATTRVTLEQTHGKLRRHLRLALPLLHLWLIAQKRGWTRTTGIIDADTPAILRRIIGHKLAL